MNNEILEEIILNVNARTGIRNEILEKDYYVCEVLKDLALKQDKLQAYFKGGTAVYKILNHMVRFSEDIDLTVKVNDHESNTSNKTRLKKSALDYNITGLELVPNETIDKKNSITSFYKYKSLFSMNELFKSEKIQIEATSFTISEPIGKYIIEPLIFKYASDDEKKILKDVYHISEFEIKIIKLERIFIDKIFAAEFYYQRKLYQDAAKHLYDIAILINNDIIQNLLNDPIEMKKLINYKRMEEKNRLGGINDQQAIKDFDYMKMDFDDEFIKLFDKMQKIYVLDEKSILNISDIKKAIETIQKVIVNL